MEEITDRRTLQIENSDGTPPDMGEPTAQLDRETLENELPSATNDSELQVDPRSQNTFEFKNDYERILPPHYKLVRMLGRGGMAEVFLALDERLNRNVAIKFLNSEFRRDPERMRRFRGEARAASALNHPNIIIIHDIGEQDGVQFIVSEYVQGETLTKRMAKGRMSLGEALDIAMQIASALSASHRAGIVHRDVKPDNVMIRRDGSVKVVDFGLAKETGEILYNPNTGYAQTLEGVATSPGLILGTPQYMSPEQARGLRLDARTDIFSLGIILYEMVTGETPFPGGSLVDVIASILGNEPRKLHELVEEPPEALERLVGKALQKDRADRHSSMDDFLAEIKALRGSYSGPHGVFDTKKTQNRATRENVVDTIPAQRSIPWGLVALIAAAIPLLLLIVTFRDCSDRSIVNSSAMRSVPITSWSSSTGELVTASSFSPDSRMIAFASTRSGAREIWVKPVEGGEPLQVTKNGFFNQYPVWAPNSQDIAFISSREGSTGIWRASFAGGEQIQIASSIASIARLVFWSSTGKLYFQEGSELFVADEKTGEKMRVTDLGSKEIQPRIIELSDNEQQIAYTIKEGGLWKVKISDLNGDSAYEVGSSSEQIEQLSWHPDGGSVTYSSSASGVYQIFLASKGNSEPVQLTSGNLDCFVEDISTDGTKILYSSVQESSDLWQVGISNSAQSAIVNEVASEFWPDISPDGGNIAYQSVNQADRPYRGAVKAVALTGPRTPLTLSNEGFAPVWSPDGRYAAFFRRSDSGISIWRVQSKGGDAQKLADGAITPPGYLATPYLKIGTNHLGWSPDGQTLAYSARTDGISNISMVSAEGLEKREVTSNTNAAENFCCPVWSRDGSEIFVVSEFNRPGSPAKRVYRLWRVPIAQSEHSILIESEVEFRFLGIGSGGEAMIAERSDPTERAAVSKAVRVIAVDISSKSKKQSLALNDVYFHNIHLSRDGRTIAFSTRAGDLSAVWTVPVEGGSPRKLIEENDPKILISSLAWSPDGRSIILGKQTRTTLLSMLSK